METFEDAVLSLHRAKMQDLERRWVAVLRQLHDDEVNWRPNDVSNSIANLVVHVVGNLRQRFVSGIGNEADIRMRDEEFNTRERFTGTELIDMLTEQFGIVDRTLLDMTPRMLAQTYETQGRKQSGLDILFGAATHTSEHLGQVLFIAKMLLGERYQIQWSPHQRR